MSHITPEDDEVVGGCSKKEYIRRVQLYALCLEVVSGKKTSLKVVELDMLGLQHSIMQGRDAHIYGMLEVRATAITILAEALAKL